MDEKKTVNVKDADEFLQEARERFRESENGMEHIIKDSLDDLAILDGEGQWDKDVKEFRENNGLICMSENLLPSFIDQVEGDFRQNKPQIDCIGVDDKSDPETARILAGMIRNISYQSQSDSIHDDVFTTMLSSSFGTWRIHTQYEDPMSFNKELVILPIENHLSLRWDMTCKKFDTSDKKWSMIIEMVQEDDFKNKYGENKQVGFNQPIGTADEGWFMNKKVRVCEYWYVKENEEPILLLNNGQVILKKDAERQLAILRQDMPGIMVINERVTQIPVVYSSIISGSEILEGPFEWPGKYIPIPIAFGKKMLLDGKLKLKSLIRDAKQSQRMHNYLISSMVQGVAMQQKAPYMGTTEQFAGKKQEWQAAADGNVPFVTYNNVPGVNPPQRQQAAMGSTGYAELLQFNSKTRMDIIGIHEAGLGMRSNEQSGVAIAQRQKEGDTGTFVFIDNFRKAHQFEGRILVDLIPKIYDTPRMMRILCNDNKEEFVKLYEPAMGPNGPYMKANLKVGKYDVVVKPGPSFSTQREQIQDSMAKTIQATGPTSPATSIILPAVIKNSDWPDGDKISRALTAMLPENIQQILNDDGTGKADDPKVMAVQQAMIQQVQQMQMQFQEQAAQMQDAIQKLQQENMQLKVGTQAKLQEIANKKELSEKEQQIAREKIVADMNIREQELQQKKEESERLFDLKVEELKASTALKFKMFMQDHVARNKMEAQSKGIKMPEDIEEDKKAESENMKQIMSEFTSMMEQTIKPLIDGVNAPKEIIRDKDGKISKVVPIKKGGSQ